MSFVSYTAGLNLPFTEVQKLNCLAWAAGGASCYLIWPGSKHLRKVEREGGRRIELPRTLRTKARLLTTAHGLGVLIPAAAFLVSLPLNRFVMPGWLAKCALPPMSLSWVYYGTRIASCVGSLRIGVAMASALQHLGSQWNYLGVRERPKLVKTGPYSVGLIIEEMRSYAMALEVCFAGMFWNWVPLAILGGVMIPVFSIKMPMEEKVILENDKIGKGYKSYKKEVPWRVLPYVW